MSATSASPRLQQVRQQLDDLDALLERMLAVPLDAPSPNPTRLHLSEDALTQTLDEALENHAPAILRLPAAVPQEVATVVPGPESPEGEVKLEAEGEAASVLPYTAPLHASRDDLPAMQQAELFPMAEPPEPEPAPVVHANLPDAVTMSTAEARTPTVLSPTRVQVAYPRSVPFASIEEKPDLAPPAPWWLALPLALNAGFDWLADRTGPFGRWTRTRLGRQFLGGTGLLCFAAAVALTLGRWLGLIWR